MKKLVDIQEELHQKILSLRGIETLISKPVFARLWEVTGKKERKKLIQYITDGDKDSIGNWMIEHTDLEPGEMPLRMLRVVGAKLNITNYSRMNKLELIAAIELREKQDGKK